jgi:hypothetical protein
MSESSEIIADRSARPDPPGRLALWLACAALVWGGVAAGVYWQQGLTLSHYDAKGHLVVARRVIDSLTPGWLQLGAVWLPLPHVLNLVPVQVDAFYRTGLSAIAISIASMALLVYNVAWVVLHFTGSRAAAVAAAAILMTNPNLLYLQSTPMTEPLLLGLLALALTTTVRALERGTPRALLGASAVLVLPFLTRYEAWPFSGALLAAVVAARWRAGAGVRQGAADAVRLVSLPVVALLWFLVHCMVTVGAWFVTGGFYVPDPVYQGQLMTVTGAVWWGLRSLGSEALARTAAAGVAAIAIWWWRRRLPATAVISLAWIGVAALPWYAFFQGHPYRIRYMVPLVVAATTIAALAVGRLPRLRALASVALVLGVWWTTRPFDPKAAMVLEAQWDLPRSIERRAVTACLPAPGGDDVVMASMGSLAHFMQETSAAGYSLRDYLHEGNGDLWLAALERPRDHVRWIAIEEVAEGGDMLAQRARENARFLEAFEPVCSGGGITLYRRRAERP